MLYVLLFTGCVLASPLEYALDLGLDFVQKNIQEINLDTVLGTRLVEAVGALMDRGVRPLWYESGVTAVTSAAPLPCALTPAFNETDSDACLREIVGPPVMCALSHRCVRKMSAPRQRDYALTHQVLYWQLAHTRGCFEVSASVRLSFCSQVMRDARRIADAQFPRHYRDLFMEQVGLCGLWGFRDFCPSSWMKAIVSWQNRKMGCFDDRAKFHCQDSLIPDRQKRREKKLKGDCLAHKTAVGLLAIAVGIRFEAEQ